MRARSRAQRQDDRSFAGYWGATKIRAAVRGMQSHTGPTPMERRRDALLGAAYVIAELRALVDRAADVLHSSVGRIEAYPIHPTVSAPTS